MYGVFSAPIAKFLEFDFPLHQLFILASVIINPVADRAFQLD